MTSQANLNSLFGNTLTPAVTNVLDIPDIGAQIQSGLGCNVDDVEESEVTLVSLMPDDSGSIRFVPGNAQAVRDGHNLVIDALKGSKQASTVRMLTRYLNGTILFPYVDLDGAIRMDTSNYDPRGGTPLYDQIAILCGTVLAKTKEFRDAGIPCRTVTAIITDGNDEGSRKHLSPASVRPIIESMLKTEMHILAAIGITDGTTDFNAVFGEMGIPSEWILTPSNNASDIRKVFRTLSQSAVRVSQARGGAGFSKAAAGGFGSP